MHSLLVSKPEQENVSTHHSFSSCLAATKQVTFYVMKLLKLSHSIYHYQDMLRASYSLYIKTVTLLRFVFL